MLLFKPLFPNNSPEKKCILGKLLYPYMPFHFELTFDKDNCESQNLHGCPLKHMQVMDAKIFIVPIYLKTVISPHLWALKNQT